MSLFNDDPTENAEDKMSDALGCVGIVAIVAVLAVIALIVGAVILLQKVL